MLNKIESSNKLANAVFHGNDKEFNYADKEEQLIADGCKRLIENCIICWNYAYLTKLIADEESKEQKDILISTIRNKSVIAWEHINLGGTYDFSMNAISNEYNFKELQDHFSSGNSFASPLRAITRITRTRKKLT